MALLEPEESVGPQGEPAISVGKLMQAARTVIRSLPLHFWVKGQVSNFSRPRSGHIYFTLKDESGQIKCAFFRNYVNRSTSSFEDGDEVFVRAQPDLYTERGELQLVVTEVSPVGQGDLQKRFEELKARLLSEGLFAPELKKPIPAFPHVVGIITSGTGAAVRDICSICSRRWPLARLLLSPVRVQGNGSAEEIAEAIAAQNDAAMADVLIVGRGGGSLEDLWSFNEELVIRAVANSRIPVISAVGHETDTTLADLVSDLRAPTPSAAAELATPDVREQQQKIRQLWNRQAELALSTVQRLELRLAQIQEKVQHPGIRTMEYMRRLDDLANRCDRVVGERWNRVINRTTRAIERLHDRSPLTILGRGYAMAVGDGGTVIQKMKQVPVGSQFQLRLQDGTIEARRVRSAGSNIKKDKTSHDQGSLF